jgi:hypothetical protein
LKLNFSRTLSQLSYAGSSLMMITVFKYDLRPKGPPPRQRRNRGAYLSVTHAMLKWTNKGKGKALMVMVCKRSRVVHNVQHHTSRTLRYWSDHLPTHSFSYY